jgi:hypothetical protein
MPPPRTDRPLPARLALIALSLVLAGVGVAALATATVPGRSTPLGWAGPLHDTAARTYGVACLLLALLPLLAFVRDRRRAIRLGIALGGVLVGGLFAALYL